MTWQASGRLVGAVDPMTPMALPEGRFATLVAAFEVFLGDKRAATLAAEELDRFLGGGGREQLPDLSLALGLLELVPGGLFATRRFSTLPVEEAAEVLDAWATSRIGVRRQIHMALRKSARFLWYDRPETWGALGYDGPQVGSMP